MKKLKKFTINPERMLTNKELVSLRGGYEAIRVYCKKGEQILCTAYLYGDCFDSGHYIMEQCLMCNPATVYFTCAEW